MQEGVDTQPDSNEQSTPDLAVYDISYPTGQEPWGITGIYETNN